MRTSASELKRRAKQTLKGHYGLCAGMIVILYAVVIIIAMVYLGMTFSLGISGVTFESIILSVVIFLVYMLMLSFVGLLTPGMTKFYLNLCRGQKGGLSDLLYAFQNKPHKFIGLYFASTAVELLWGIPYAVVLVAAVITDFIPVMAVLLTLTYLFLVVGMIFTVLFLSQAGIILVENPDKKVWDSLKESVRMMKGQKGNLFYLYISFAGMIVLGYCTLGIGLLWIFPYIQCSVVHFYLDLKAKEQKCEEEDLQKDQSGYSWNDYSGAWEQEK